MSHGHWIRDFRRISLRVWPKTHYYYYYYYYYYYVLPNTYYYFLPVAPPANCSSISDSTTFCANAGANGLIDSPAATLCDADPCVIAVDNSTCCKQAGRIMQHI